MPNKKKNDIKIRNVEVLKLKDLIERTSYIKYIKL